MVKHGIIHVHSEHSLFDSTQRVEAIVKRAAEIGCKNITLTDHGALSGIDDFMDAGKEYGVNTIPGVEAYLEERAHLVIVAKDYEGFVAISHAVRDANTNQYVLKNKNSLVYPIMTKAMMEKNFKDNKHVIATSACIQGPISRILLKNRKIDMRIRKLQEAAAPCLEDAKKYTQINAEIESIKDEISSAQDRKKEIKKYTTASFCKKLEKMRQDAEGLMSPIKEFQLQEVETMQLLRDSALQETKELDQKIEEVKARKTELGSEKKKYKANFDKAKKYETAISDEKANKEPDLYEQAKAAAAYYAEVFPEFYIELQNHGLSDELYVMPLLAKIAKELNIPVIAANDAHMTDNSEDSITARQVLRFNYFEKHQTLSPADRELYIKTDEELIEALSAAVGTKTAMEAIENTSCLEECKVIFPKGEHYPKVKGQGEEEFDKLLMEARQKKINEGEWDDIHEERLKKEVQTIKSMGYVDYLLVVRDFCNTGHKLGTIPKSRVKDIPEDAGKILEWIDNEGFKVGIGVGPGRGSAVGSLVCYLFGITNLDPIKYDLLFERFLNPERISMPDIDTDIRTSLRPTLIRILRQQYGKNAVCSIQTENRYAAKGAIQMAGRDRSSELYDNLPDAEKDEKKAQYYKKTMRISDMIPDSTGMIAKYKADIIRELGQDEESMVILKNAELIQGTIFSFGIHAGGVVISDNDDVNSYIPLAWKRDKQVWATQCDMNRVEQKGLLKMDLLGLNTLDVMSDCALLVLMNQGVTIDFDKIPFESEVFSEIYSTGMTNSVFQFESGGMKSMLKQFKPACFEDIILLVAAYRPGPMQYLDKIIAVKNHTQPLEYLVPQLEPILSKTYGATIYQEQVMQIFQILAGYSLGGADLVRRAMSKKKEEKLKIERKSFVYGDPERKIKGCVENGISEEKANTLFDELMDFAKYAFNKSHAASYAYVSYQTAWLKYHYPVEFLCSMFNNKDQSDYGPLLEDCNSYGIELLPPSINHSYYDFVVEKGKIRYGIKGIKGIKDESPVEFAIQMRSSSRSESPYTSFDDFLERNCVINENGKITLPDKKFIEGLIFSGAFDEFTEDREYLGAYYGKVAIAVKEAKSDYHLMNILNNIPFEPGEKDPVFNRNAEMDYLSTVISDNPLKEYKDDGYYGCIPICDMPTNGFGSIMGIVQDVEKKVSKNNNPMLVLKVQGKSGMTTVFAMRQAYTLYAERDLTGKVYKFSGNFTDGGMFVKQINMFSVVRKSYIYCCKDEDDIKRVQNTLNNPGDPEADLRIVYCADVTGRDGQKVNLPQVTKSYAVSYAAVKEIGAVPERQIDV